MAYGGRDVPGYRLGSVIGAGGSGTVFGGTCLLDDAQVAVKCVKFSDRSRRAAQGAQREADFLARLRHPNVVKLVEAIEQDDRALLVLERADSGDLTHLIEACREEEVDLGEDQLMFGFAQIGLALSHLHTQGILHRDVKPKNILVHKGSVLKLCDFDSAIDIQHASTQTNQMVGTASYLAPEVLQGHAYSEKSDVWALGCVLYEMTHLRQAFDGPTIFAVMRNIVAGERQSNEGQCSPGLSSLINNLLQQDPKERYTMQEALSSQYVLQYISAYAAFLEREHEDVSSLGLEFLQSTSHPDPHVDLHMHLNVDLEPDVRIHVQSYASGQRTPGVSSVSTACMNDLMPTSSGTDDTLFDKGAPLRLWRLSRQGSRELQRDLGVYQAGDGHLNTLHFYDTARLRDWTTLMLTVQSILNAQ